MQCPACNNDYEVADFGEPARCPGCGVYYEKAMALKQRRLAAQAEAEKAESSAAPDSLGKLAGALKGAKLAVSEGRRERGLEQKRIEEAHSVSAARPVVVVDIKMGFWSMVVFMVKWAFAAIPAMLIIAVIGAMLFGFLIGFVGGVGGFGGRAPALSPPVQSQGPANFTPEKIVTPVDMADSFWLLGLREDGGIVHMTVRTDAANGGKLYSEFAVNCSSGRGMIVAAGGSVSTMQPDPRVKGFEPINPNTPRQTIAARGCRGKPGTHEILK
ncbi:hypothetical protein ACNFCJ_20795 [Pseudomonas sp. NY15364]|uniref:hypothetical protein n=1 Tax=Pseudomonas sp. NY15364 TaxID=3400353 RepID=UPI003A877AF0